MKVFDLNKNYNFTKDVQNNLKILKKECGTKFFIKTKNYKIPVILTLKKLTHKKLSFYELKYNIKRLEDSMFPFLISFYTRHNDLLVGNDAYINNIIKTDKISGSKMVLLVLEILKKLNVKEASLYDGTQIDCGDKKLELTWFKLLEKKRGFYEKFGFKYDMDTFKKNFFANKDIMYDHLHNQIDKFRKIKISYYKEKYQNIINLISTVIINQDFNKVEVGIKYGCYLSQMTEDMKDKSCFLYKKKKDIKEYLLGLIDKINNLLEIFKNTKQTLLYKLMIELFNDTDCKDYLKIWNNIVRDYLYFIKYKKDKYIFDNLHIIDTMLIARNSVLVYKFY